MKNANKLLTPQEVARFLDVNITTVYRYCRDGRIPAVKVGNLWRIRPQDLDHYTDPTNQQPTQHGGQR